MQSYQEMSREELLREKESLEQQYKEICKKGLKLDMTRGKPSKEQLVHADDGRSDQQDSVSQQSRYRYP